MPRSTILVIDDNLDNVRSLVMLLDTMGHHVDYAINATVAVDFARRFQPDIVFLDLLLPDDHGAGVCRELKALPELQQTRIIAVTASSHMLDHQLALDAGCDVLRKPVSQKPTSACSRYVQAEIAGLHRSREGCRDKARNPLAAPFASSRSITCSILGGSISARSSSQETNVASGTFSR